MYVKVKDRCQRECVYPVWYSGPDQEHSNTGAGGGIECRRQDVSGISCKGMRGGHPLSYRGFGGSPRENVGNCGAGEAFLSLF